MEKGTKKIRIAIADDTPFLREVFRHILNTQSQMELIVEMENGQEAVNYVTQYPEAIDVFIMDLVMPKMSGLEAIKKILKINPKIKIIACSTLEKESIVMQVLEEGSCSFLPKPFTPQQLITAIEQSMREFHEEDI